MNDNNDDFSLENVSDDSFDDPVEEEEVAPEFPPPGTGPVQPSAPPGGALDDDDECVVEIDSDEDFDSPPTRPASAPPPMPPAVSTARGSDSGEGAGAGQDAVRPAPFAQRPSFTTLGVFPSCKPSEKGFFFVRRDDLKACNNNKHVILRELNPPRWTKEKDKKGGIGSGRHKTQLVKGEGEAAVQHDLLLLSLFPPGLARQYGTNFDLGYHSDPRVVDILRGSNPAVAFEHLDVEQVKKDAERIAQTAHLQASGSGRLGRELLDLLKPCEEWEIEAKKKEDRGEKQPAVLTGRRDGRGAGGTRTQTQAQGKPRLRATTPRRGAQLKRKRGVLYSDDEEDEEASSGRDDDNGSDWGPETSPKAARPAAKIRPSLSPLKPAGGTAAPAGAGPVTSGGAAKAGVGLGLARKKTPAPKKIAIIQLDDEGSDSEGIDQPVPPPGSVVRAVMKPPAPAPRPAGTAQPKPAPGPPPPAVRGPPKRLSPAPTPALKPSVPAPAQAPKSPAAVTAVQGAKSPKAPVPATVPAAMPNKEPVPVPQTTVQEEAIIERNPIPIDPKSPLNQKMVQAVKNFKRTKHIPESVQVDRGVEPLRKPPTTPRVQTSPVQVDGPLSIPGTEQHGPPSDSGEIEVLSDSQVDIEPFNFNQPGGGVGGAGPGQESGEYVWVDVLRAIGSPVRIKVPAHSVNEKTLGIRIVGKAF